MALITSAASGNFNAGATWTGGVVPGVGDEARASTGHTITITANATCDEVSNAGTGIFTLNDGVTLTANVTSKSTTTSRNCLQFTAASPASATIIGNVTGGTVSGAVGVAHTSTGTLTITGNILAGSALNAHAVSLSTSGSINVTGNVTGGSATAYGINKSGNSSASITGNVSGGSGNQSIGILCGNTTASFTVTGNVNGGTAANANGIYFSGSGTITVSGIATGGTLGPVSGSNTGAGIHQVGSGTVIVKRAVGNAYGPGNVSGLAPTPGISNNAAGIFQVEELEFGQYGMSPTTGAGIRLKKVTGNYVTFPYVDSGAAKTLVDATQGQMPAASDVRFGTVYASGALTGSCYVPAAASVAFGVPVDNTTGTAALTPASIWDYALSSITASSTIGTLLKTNIDATISSRSTATTAGIADAVWDEVLTGATHNINASAGKRLRQLASNIVIDGEVVSATSNTVTLDAGASSDNGAYDPALILITEGPGAGESRLILAYNGGTKTCVLDRDWKFNPTSLSKYVILSDPGREHVNEGLAQGGTATSITLNTSASASDGAYIGQTVFIRSGTGSDQARRVISYNGTTKVATVQGWSVTPDTTSAYVMLPTGSISNEEIASAVWDEILDDTTHDVENSAGRQVSEMHLLQGLRSGETLTVTPTSRTAGAISQTIGGDGTTTTTVSRD